MYRILQTSATLALVLILAGCKLVVISTPGGDVVSLSGTRDCIGTDTCDFEIANPNFSETFTATPKLGYEFVKWQNGDGFNCKDSTNPSCTIALSGDAASQIIITLFQSSYLMPVYIDIGIDTDGDGVRNELDDDDDNDGILDLDDDCPLDETLDCIPNVVVDDREWTQPGLFNFLSWNDINAICPEDNAGVCVDNGMLNGYDMTGWTWAAVEDVNALYNHFIGYPVVPPSTPYRYVEPFYSTGMDRLFSSGFIPMFEGGSSRKMLVFTRTTYLSDSSKAHSGEFIDYLVPDSYLDTWSTSDRISKNTVYNNVGGIFYRTSN